MKRILAILGIILPTVSSILPLQAQLLAAYTATEPESASGLSISPPEVLEKDISGTVTDESGIGLPGVNVLIKSTNTGTITDIEGKYALQVPDDATTLIFSFVGYLTKELAINNQSTLHVVMNTDAQELSEVVVTALGIEREERSLGYSVQEISTEGIDEARRNQYCKLSPGPGGRSADCRFFG